MAGDLRVMGSNPGRNLQAIFDLVLPLKIPKQIFPARLMINIARRTIKIKIFKFVDFSF